MSIESWGPKTWSILHVCSFMYPDTPTHNEKLNMYNFIHSLSLILPCPKCKKHFRENIRKHIPYTDSSPLESKRNLSQYIVDIHNEVNQRNNKPTWTYAQSELHYCGNKMEVCALQNKETTDTTLDINVSSTTKPTGNSNTCIKWVVICLIIFTIVCLFVKNNRYIKKYTLQNQTFSNLFQMQTQNHTKLN